MDDTTDLVSLMARARQLKEADPARALEVFQQARQLAEKLKDAQTIANSLFESGRCRYDLSDYSAAQADYSRSGAIFHALGDVAGEAVCIDETGACLGEMGDNAAALEKNFSSLALWQTIEKPSGLTRCLNNIGNRYFYFGQYDLALEYYQRSLALRETARDLPGMAETYNNLAIINHTYGNYDQALSYYQNAIKIYEELGSSISLANTLMNLGEMIIQSHGKPEDARAALERALSLARGANKSIEALCFQELGNMARSQADQEGAQAFYRSSLTLLAQIGNQLLMADLNLELARSQLAQKDAPAALLSLNQALNQATAVNASEDLCQAHKLLFEAYEMQADLPHALEHHKEYHRLRELALSRETELKVKGLLIKADTEKSHREAEIYRLKNEELSKTQRDLQKALDQNNELLNELTLKTEDLLRQVWEDSLTRIHNRRYLEMRLVEESERARRFGHDFALVMIDIDDFKAINDHFSHHTGDRVLIRAGQILLSSCRVVDIVTRFGGDEFMLLLVETSPEQALVAAEKVRQAVEQYDWAAIQPGMEITISLGLASFKNTPEGTSLVEIADTHLYQAKHAGKNRVVGSDVL